MVCYHRHPKVIGVKSRGSAEGDLTEELQSAGGPSLINTEGDTGWDVSDSRRSFDQPGPVFSLKWPQTQLGGSLATRAQHTGRLLTRDYTRAPQAALCPHYENLNIREGWIAYQGCDCLSYGCVIRL